MGGSQELFYFKRLYSDLMAWRHFSVVGNNMYEILVAKPTAHWSLPSSWAFPVGGSPSVKFCIKIRWQNVAPYRSSNCFEIIINLCWLCIIGPCTSPQRSFPRLPLVKIDVLDQVKRLAAQPWLKSLRQRFNKEENRRRWCEGSFFLKEKWIKVSFIVVIVSFRFILCWVIKGKTKSCLDFYGKTFLPQLIRKKKKSWMVESPRNRAPSLLAITVSYW